MTDKMQRIGRAIGRIASGVFIVTAERDGLRDGLLASWINQAAFEPPMLTVAIMKDRPFLDFLGIDKRFTVNVLSKENMDVFKNFARPFEPGLDRFEGIELVANGNAGPVIAKSIAFLDCITRTSIDAGDHVLIVGEILDGGLLKSDADPMIHLRKNGFQY